MTFVILSYLLCDSDETAVLRSEQNAERGSAVFYGKLPILLLAELVEHPSDATNARIASYILTHMEDLRDLSIKDLAADCYVSTASVSYTPAATDPIAIATKDAATIRDFLFTSRFPYL